VAEETPEDIMKRTLPYAKEWGPEARKLWLEEHPSGKKEDRIGSVEREMSLKDEATVSD
jgi:hypothetical protein